MKTNIIIFMLICLLALSSCNAKTPPVDTEPGITTTASTTAAESTAPTTTVIEKRTPTTNDELFEYIISKWKQNKAAELYEYAAPELSELLCEEDFVYLFDSISDIGGALNTVSDKLSSTSDGTTTYTALLNFDNITAELSIDLKDLKICSFTRNVHFKDTFELERDDGIVEKYFVLENDGYKLNAVYTYVNDAKAHPAALLIAGSGPSDYNSTVGLLTPFEDIAIGLARNGINSLRVDKRTFNYSSETGADIRIEQEYLYDCTAAIDFLKNQNISELYLLGHSLGAQIAAELAVGNSAIHGLILFNSSPRHLADIACDQYSLIDPANKSAYRTYADAAKSVSEDTIRGYYYYSAGDAYWASYNRIDTVKNITDVNANILIINSTFDNQIFDTDIELWKSNFADNPNITVRIFDDISHFGYKIDTADPSAVYKRVAFPDELIKEFSDFIKGTQ